MGKKAIKKTYPLQMAFPAIAIFMVFYVFSIVSGFGYALTNWNTAYTEIDFVGLENFVELFSSEQFWMAVKNSFIISFFGTLIKVTLGLGLAILLNKEFAGRNFFRALFYFPCILTTLVVGYLFKFLLQPKVGLLSTILGSIGLDGLAQTEWLGHSTALKSVIGVETWMWVGYAATILLAGFQTIPKELEEAAIIDGANAFQTFRFIKMPFIQPSITILTTLSLISGFKAFDLVLAMTGGGPIFATETLGTFLFKVQGRGVLGYASAIGLAQFFIITLVVVPVLLFLKRRENKE